MIWSIFNDDTHLLYKVKWWKILQVPGFEPTPISFSAMVGEHSPTLLSSQLCRQLSQNLVTIILLSQSLTSSCIASYCHISKPPSQDKLVPSGFSQTVKQKVRGCFKTVNSQAPWNKAVIITCALKSVGYWTDPRFARASPITNIFQSTSVITYPYASPQRVGGIYIFVLSVRGSMHPCVCPCVCPSQTLLPW